MKTVVVRGYAISEITLLRMYGWGSVLIMPAIAIALFVQPQLGVGWIVLVDCIFFLRYIGVKAKYEHFYTDPISGIHLREIDNERINRARHMKIAMLVGSVMGLVAVALVAATQIIGIIRTPHLDWSSPIAAPSPAAPPGNQK